MASAEQTVESQFFDCESQSKDIVDDRESSVESFHTNKSELSNANTADSELIDVDDIELSDEESWLYQSPRRLSNDQNGVIEKTKENSLFNSLQHSITTKDALVNKLSQLQMNGKPRYNLPLDSAKDFKLPNNHCTKETDSQNMSDSRSSDNVRGKENHILDVHKLAELQEKRLKQSTPVHMSQSVISYNGTFKEEKSCSLSPGENLAHLGLDVSLLTKDSHKGSLPNINPNYHTLQTTRKNSTPSSLKTYCPLPRHPSHLKLHESESKNRLPDLNHRPSTSPSCNQSHTLPSSYRHRNSTLSLTPSPRREQSPLLPRRDSAPTKFHTSPLSSPTMSQRSYLTSARNPHLAGEHQRSASCSPSRRLPLTMVHNRSPRHSPASPKRGLSKIPGPAMPRSGIPKPSSQNAKSNPGDDSWCRDCF